MIKNYKQYNESIRNLLVGPTKKEMFNNFKIKYKKQPDILLFQCCEFDIPYGVQYALKHGGKIITNSGNYDEYLNLLLSKKLYDIVIVFFNNGISFSRIPDLDKLEELLKINPDIILSFIKNITPNEGIILCSRLYFLDGIKNSVKNGADINYISGFPLRNACENNKIDIVKYLINNGADINIKDGYCLKHSLENYDIVKLLLENGIKVRRYYYINKSIINNTPEITELLKKYLVINNKKN